MTSQQQRKSLQQSLPPFEKRYQLKATLDPEQAPKNVSADGESTSRLPGHPMVPLDNTQKLESFLHLEMFSSDLDIMAPYLWLMSRQTGTNVSPLHRQYVKNRRIVITEEAKLHLVWIDNRIFIKPLPAYLLSYAFWDQKLQPDNSKGNVAITKQSRAAALGFLRSYCMLIRYKSDYEIAARPEARLLPACIEYDPLILFLASVEANVSDEVVSMRYHYGELRLSRLNFYGKFILRRQHFHRVHSQYGAYFGRFYVPVLFLIEFLSMYLNAMQVGLGVEQVTSGQLGRLIISFKWFAFFTLVVGTWLVLGLLGLFIYKFVKEWSFAAQERHRKSGCTKKLHCINSV
ncbi:MAG: hypothetical protein MMC23_000381 [Stictis urceolatum]|nr:hypothetical protein [Stictis urceolata]